MPTLSLCGGDIILLVEGGGLSVGLTFAFNKINRLSMTGGVTKNSSPSPIGTSITDHLVRNPDKVSVSGSLGCRNCDRTLPVLQLLSPSLKKATSSVIYNNDFFLLTSNTFIATNMVLIDYSIDHQQSTSQILDIAMEFEAQNISGQIQAPSMEAGGFLGF